MIIKPWWIPLPFHLPSSPSNPIPPTQPAHPDGHADGTVEISYRDLAFPHRDRGFTYGSPLAGLSGLDRSSKPVG